MRAKSPSVAVLLLALVLPVLAMPLSAQEWAGRGRLTGEVKDEAGKPVVGAQVFLRKDVENIDPANPGDGPDTLTTDKRGRFATLGLAGGSWTVLIVKEGLMQSIGTVQVNEFETASPLKVTLHPLPEEVLQEAEPNPAVALIQEGNAALSAEKFAEARAKYEQALTTLPPEHHAAVLRGVARTYFAEDKPEPAIATLQRTLELEPGNAETLQLLVTLLYQVGREEEARSYQAQLPAGTKVDPTVLLNLGIKRYNDGDMEAALTEFEKVVAENPELPEAYYYRGLAHLALGHNPQAKADFQKLLELAPDHAKAADAREFLASL
jgi:tetratricopeptide (TPR) repeat protein